MTYITDETAQLGQNLKREIGRKAHQWLEKNAKLVADTWCGDGFKADIYRIKRPNKPSVWFCVDYVWLSHYVKIRRICRN